MYAIRSYYDHQKCNGFGYEAAVWALQNAPVPTELIGLEDTFAESGAYLKTLDKFGSYNFV